MTVYNFDEEMSAGAATLQPTDKVLIHEASSSTKKYLLGSAFLSGSKTPVNSTATVIALTQVTNGNRWLTLSAAAPCAITLPQSLGKGDVYSVQIQVAATGTATTIATANETDVLQGAISALTTSSNAMDGWVCSATSNTVSLNGTTKGGVAGDWYKFTDVKTGFWIVEGVTAPSGTYATPFSHV